MNKRLESLFDLPEMPSDEISNTDMIPSESITELRTTLDMSKRIDAALNEVKDIDSTERDLDNLAAKA